MTRMCGLSMNKLWIAIIAFGASFDVGAAQGWLKTIRNQTKPTIVNIETHPKVGLHNDDAVPWAGTGFVLDWDKGLVLTNKHVSGISPCITQEITFSSGETLSVRTVYVHPWHDYAFLKFDPSQLKRTRPAELSIGNVSSVQEGDVLVQIGNTERNPYSTSTLIVANDFTNQGVAGSSYRHTHMFHLSGMIAGGASGSPVLNQKGEVVGLINSSDQTQAFALRIDYVLETLKQLQAGQSPSNGDLGISLNTISVSDIEKYLGLTTEAKMAFDKMVKVFPDAQEFLKIHGILPSLAKQSNIQVGDILVSFKSGQTRPKTIGNDMFSFDTWMDQSVGKSITLSVIRDGQSVIKVPLKVKSAWDVEPKSFVTFGFGTFHDITPNLSVHHSFDQKGVFLTESAANQSAFGGLGLYVGNDNTHGKKRVFISQISSFEINNLKDFIKAIGALQKEKKKRVVVYFRDQQEYSAKLRTDFVDLDFESDPLKYFEFDPKKMQWTERKI